MDVSRTLRTYGRPPYSVAVVHGGPGAPGEMAPVAQELSGMCGILEPLQTEASLDGQVHELAEILKKKADLPVTLIGWSWGAWLSFITTAEHPLLIKKLILVGSGPFEEQYALPIMKTRLGRLTKEEQKEAQSLMDALEDASNSPAVKNKDTKDSKDTIMAKFGALISKADSYDPLPPPPLPHKDEVLACNYRVYQQVWSEAHELRKSGKLLALASRITCPVVAIHGDYDPHPAEGVREPLSCILPDFKFVLLEKCGHHPWLERHAKKRFFDILRKEIG